MSVPWLLLWDELVCGIAPINLSRLHSIDYHRCELLVGVVVWIWQCLFFAAEPLGEVLEGPF